MKIKVIKDAYLVSENLTYAGVVSKDEFESSYIHLLVVGDVWELRVFDGYKFFECIEGKWLDEGSDGWWEYEGIEGYFEVIE